MSGRIEGNPTQLRAESRTLADASRASHETAGSLRSLDAPMPPGVHGHFSAETHALASMLDELSVGFQQVSKDLAWRATAFEDVERGGSTSWLYGMVSLLSAATAIWPDVLSRTLTRPPYIRFGRWVRGYSYFNKYGTEVSVARNWRNLPNKLMHESQVFRSIGEDSAWMKGAKWAGRAGSVISFADGALGQWGADANRRDLTAGDRVYRAGVVGTSESAGGWAGAEAGAVIGAELGSLVPVPVVGTVAGGVIGAVAGGIIGSDIGKSIGQHIVDLVPHVPHIHLW